MGIIGWIVLGFLAGVIGKALVSGDEGIGFILTTILGIVGAIAGGLVATALGFGDPVDEFFDLSTWLAAIIGSAAILLAWRAIAART